MEKEIRISMRIDKELKQAFFDLCEENDQIPSKVLKRLMQEHLERNGKLLVATRDGRPPEYKK